MRTEFRVALYLHHYGYTPARVSELMAVPLSEVIGIKCGRPPKSKKVEKAPRILKPRCKPKDKRSALELVKQGKTPEEAAVLANVCVSTVKEALRHANRGLPKGHLP